jgi:hypothetical protein
MHRSLIAGAIAVFLFGGTLSACSRAPGASKAGSPAGTGADTEVQPTMNALSPQEAASGWRLLFDGRTTAGWRGFRRAEIPAGWQVVDGALTRVAEGGDIVTTDQFGNFELALEWNVAPGANSGVMYRVSEDVAAPYESGPEMQVLDDARHPDGKSRLTAAGSLFALYPAREGVVRPAGEWNAARVIVNGNHVEHWLNGVRVVDYELGSPDWEARVRASKFQQWPSYGRARSGHIALQDHGDRVAYRNVKIRELK